MEQYITAGLIGSLVTIVIQAIINAISVFTTDYYSIFYR